MYELRVRVQMKHLKQVKIKSLGGALEVRVPALYKEPATYVKLAKKCDPNAEIRVDTGEAPRKNSVLKVYVPKYKEFCGPIPHPVRREVASPSRVSLALLCPPSGDSQPPSRPRFTAGSRHPSLGGDD